MKRRILIAACVFGVLAVILGAFGAHGLKNNISLSDLENWKTAVSYHFYHTLALLFLAQAGTRNKWTSVAFIAFSLGIIFFSGSLYLLSTRTLTGFYWPVLGPVTPVGGLFFIIGWISLLVSGIKNN